MYCYGYTGRLRTDYRGCFGGYRVRLHESHQVRCCEGNKDRLRTTQVL